MLHEPSIAAPLADQRGSGLPLEQFELGNVVCVRWFRPADDRVDHYGRLGLQLLDPAEDRASPTSAEFVGLDGIALVRFEPGQLRDDIRCREVVVVGECEQCHVDVVTALAWGGRSGVLERRGRVGCGVGSSAVRLLETGPQLPDPLVHRKLADEAGQHDLAPDPVDRSRHLVEQGAHGRAIRS